jgi:hypothetical protein
MYHCDSLDWVWKLVTPCMCCYVFPISRVIKLCMIFSHYIWVHPVLVFYHHLLWWIAIKTPYTHTLWQWDYAYHEVMLVIPVGRDNCTCILMVCCGVNFLSNSNLCHIQSIHIKGFWEHSTLILMDGHMEASIHRYCVDTGVCLISWVNTRKLTMTMCVECTETLCICIKLTCCEYDEGRVPQS